jgi:hypothetical protein
MIHVAYIDQFALTFNQDLERWTGILMLVLKGILLTVTMMTT